MIHIHIDNILKTNIGWRYGISKKKLEEFTHAHQHLVSGIFKNRKKEGFAFVDLPEQGILIRKIKNYATEQKKQNWENIVVLGIGGSALGLIALKEALLNELTQKPKLYVLDNIDPVIVSRLLSYIKTEKTLFIVISKSGTTVEPMALYNVIRPMLIKKRNRDYYKNFLFITDKTKGILRKIAKKENIQTFDIPSKVGGRFSVLTSVGLVPAQLAGIDSSKLLKGAAKMRDKIKESRGLENPALTLASIQFLMDRKEKRPITVLMPYSNLLFRMGDWYRQLLAESIGKNKKTGPTPINALGSTDQHSQLQLYMEGPQDKLLIFLKLLKWELDMETGMELPREISFLNGKKLSRVMEASYQGTSGALKKNQRPNLTIEIEKMDEETMGALFILFEFQVALLGEFYRINAFNQPGVEEGKRISRMLLSETGAE